MRIRDFLIPASLVLLAAGCVTRTSTDLSSPPEGWVGRMVSHQKVVSEKHGIVGYLKVYEYAHDGYGEPFRLFHVYDLDFRERGILNESGTGTKYVWLPPEIARARGTTRDDQALGAQPLTYNVAMILDVPADLKLAPTNPGAGDLSQR